MFMMIMSMLFAAGSAVCALITVRYARKIDEMLDRYLEDEK